MAASSAQNCGRRKKTASLENSSRATQRSGATIQWTDHRFPPAAGGMPARADPDESSVTLCSGVDNGFRG